MPSKTNSREYDIAVVGAGLTGLTAALSLAPVCADHDLRLALIAPVNTGVDGRTTALLKPSIDLMQSFGIWDACASHSAPLRTMRLIDGSNRLIRAPLTDFKAGELDIEAFGYNVPNDRLSDVLELTIKDTPHIERIFAKVSKVACRQDSAELELNDDSVVRAKLIAASDGRHSPSRSAAGIETRNWSYPQSAVVLTFKHALPHHSTSSEFHTETGPFTQVPLPPLPSAKHRSSLVWVVKPEQASELLELSREDLATKIESKMQRYLGAVELEVDPQVFPLSGMTAKRFADNRVVLLGEAAHVFPPIGAQGLNLGLRDVSALQNVLQRLPASPSENKIDVGTLLVTEAFHQARTKDVYFSTGAVDILNRSLLADFLPVQAARALGLATLGQFGWLKKQIMQRGFGPTGLAYRDGNRSGGSAPVAMK